MAASKTRRVSASSKQSKLLVLGAVANEPKTMTQIQRITGLSYAEAYLAAAELHNEGKIDYPAARVG